MNITATLTLNQEQIDALQERVDLYNAGSGQAPLTPTQFLEQVQLVPFIEELATQRYNASLNRLGSAFKVLPYDARLATIAELESKLP
jgi:hypothetical protein